MKIKRGIFLIVLLILPIVYAQQCLIPSQENNQEVAQRIWSLCNTIYSTNCNFDTASSFLNSLPPGWSITAINEELRKLSLSNDCEINQQRITERHNDPSFQKISQVYGEDIARIILDSNLLYCYEDPFLIIKKSRDAYRIRNTLSIEIRRALGIPPMDVLKYLDDSRDRTIVSSIISASQASMVPPDTLAAAAFKEGLNDWVELQYYNNPKAKIDGFTSLGLWDFVTDIDKLKREGFLREDFNDYRIKDSHVTFNDLTPALEAFGAELAWRRAIFLKDAKDKGYDLNSISEEQMNYWTYIYFNCGTNCGKTRLNRGIEIPNRSSHRAHLNSKKVIATIDLFQKAELFRKEE